MARCIEQVQRTLRVLSLAVVALTFFNPITSASASSSRGISGAPAGLVAAMAQVADRSAASDPAYAIGRDGCATAGGQSGRLAGCLGAEGAHFTFGKEKVGLRLVAWGRADRMVPVQLTRETPKGNRIEYAGRHIREWWRVLPLGFEQGFTIDESPAGQGEVVLELAASTASVVEEDGTLAWGDLRYGKLLVTDADGLRLPARLTAKGRTIRLAFDGRDARYPVTVDPMVWSEAKISPSDGVADDMFGYAVAISGDGNTALIGARDGSQVYFFVRDAGGSWTEADTIAGGDGYAFGTSVALSQDGSTAVVGDTGNASNGAIYIYTRAGNTWTDTYPVGACETGEAFGHAVAISADGNTVLSSCYQATVGLNADQGKVLIYTREAGGSWQGAGLGAAGLGANYEFGYSLALSDDGNTALVGAPGADGDKGAAYLFTRSGSSWTQTAHLADSASIALDRLGTSVALDSDGSAALVGAPGVNSSRGAVYFWTTAEGWDSPTATIEAGDGAAGDHFGSVVALANDGATLVVGVEDSNGGQGAVYLYAAETLRETKLTASEGATNDRFGAAVALADDGATLLVGAYNVDSHGAAYLLTGKASGGGGGGALSMVGLGLLIWIVRRRSAGRDSGQAPP